MHTQDENQHEGEDDVEHKDVDNHGDDDNDHDGIDMMMMKMMV